MIKDFIKFKKKGFSLIETIVAISIFSLILVAIFGSALILYRTYDYNWQQAIAVEEARRGVENMVQELRMARTGENGSYALEKAEDKEIVFYSDIDGDGKTEKVRYFLGTISNGQQSKECQSTIRGGTCTVTFSNFLAGNLISAQLTVSAQGNLGRSNEYVTIYADNNNLDNICTSGCYDCSGSWQGTKVFDVTNYTSDNYVTFLARASSAVDPICPFSMKVKFDLSWTEDISSLVHELKKGVTKPVISQNGEVIYPENEEKISIITSYVRNTPPIFEYFDENGNKIESSQSRLLDTKLIKVHLVVNVNPNSPPNQFELESYAQIRNLKKEQ